MKKFRKIVILIFMVSLLFILFGMDMPVACHARGRVIERDDWRIWQFTYGSRHTTLLGLNDRSLIVDGVLTIPTRVGTRNIHGFGAALAGSFNPGPGVRKIVVPAELRVGDGFWNMRRISNVNVRYVEFLCNVFTNINMRGGSQFEEYRFTIIIPDGSTQNFIDRFISPTTPQGWYTFYEKSYFLENQNNV